MENEIYQKLAEHLDRLPGGFRPSETGADLRLLRRLFTPEEADLATHLTLEREEASVVAERAGLALPEAEQRLGEMALKGLIFSVQPEEGPALYQAVPWVVGIYEFQVNNLNKDLLEAVDDYWSTAKSVKPRVRITSQMRTIPVGRSIEPRLDVLPYEQVDALVSAHETFAVAPCICRRHARLEEGGCDAPEESCLMFGDFADYYVRTGRGRAIDRAEVFEILARADEANLVLQPTNSQQIAAICCCCGCCCGVLGWIKRQPKPAEVVVSSFLAELDPETCVGCWTCLERCQMGALAADGDRVALDRDRCIGCGLCVSTCPSGALTLARKPDSEQMHVPVDFFGTWREISQAQAEM